MTLDRLKEAVARAIGALLTRIDYTALYGAAIIADNGDGTLDVRCDDSRLGDLQRVPLRLGMPGVKLTFKKLGRVEIGFTGADPRRPFASVFDAGSFATIELVGQEGSTAKSVARVGDVATAQWPPGMMITGTVTTPLGPIPLAGPLLFLNPTVLVGVIAQGSGILKA